jgi:formylmethanofuran dehydrogenase subunit E-like metal-binding protein
MDATDASGRWPGHKTHSQTGGWESMRRLLLSSLLLVGGLLLFSLSARGENRPMNPWEDNSLYALAWKASQQAVKETGRGKDGTLLVLTNAGYAKPGGLDSTAALEAITEVTGCSPGKGNLWVIHSALDQPLYFFFFSRRSGDSFYAEAHGAAIRADGKASFQEILSREPSRLFRHAVLKNISPASLSSDPEETEKEIKKRAHGGNWASLAALAHLWTLDPPMELVRAVQFHDHICPGVMSGYYIARFLSANFPLEGEQRYFFIASPSYCKDDALQVIFNQTVGKRGMALLPLSEEDQATLLPEARDAAGIFFRYDPKTGKGNGAVIGFAWQRLRQDSGSGKDKRFPFLASLEQIRWMVDQRDQYGRYIYFIKTFDLPPGEVPQNYARLGVNPWEKLGLWDRNRKEKKP